MGRRKVTRRWAEVAAVVAVQRMEEGQRVCGGEKSSKFGTTLLTSSISRPHS